jgi:lipopolysaccharide transport system permease protein|tara:strand:+ start:2079 stop:2984 length:906 start_codon:yes stop_codon:yes gene_type:complete
LAKRLFATPSGVLTAIGIIGVISKLPERFILKLIIEHSKCLVLGERTKIEKAVDREKVLFMVRTKFRKTTKRRFLGYAWLVLDPLILSLIYLFVFTVVRANINATSILIGITMYRVFQTSLMAGISAIPDPNGGLKCERISTKILLSATVLHRTIDIFFQTSLITGILVYAFDTSVSGGFIFLILCQIMGFLFFGFGSILSPLVKRIPDIGTLIGYVLRLGFFASPAMYPMSRMTGLHYNFNEYNPFAYFAESARLLLGVDSVFESLNPLHFLLIVTVLVLLTIIGFKRIDFLRWRMTTWS